MANGFDNLSRPGTFGHAEKFRFDCHPGLNCFGQCCRDISIFLTPYDVLRLRRSLGLSSGDFLRRYTAELDVPGSRFPLFYLKMNENDLKCPFVTPKGCSVYRERPWSCRMAPLDMTGPGSFRIAFDREKCLGLNGEREWTPVEWMDSQEMSPYDTMEETFKELPRLIRFTGRQPLDRTLLKLFRLTCYDPDGFKDFILRHKFLIREAGLNPEDFMRSLKGDPALLNSATRWLINVSESEKTLKKIDKII